MAGCAIAFDENRANIHQVLAVRPTRDGQSRMEPTRAGFLTANLPANLGSEELSPSTAGA